MVKLTSELQYTVVVTLSVGQSVTESTVPPTKELMTHNSPYHTLSCEMMVNLPVFREANATSESSRKGSVCVLVCT